MPKLVPTATAAPCHLSAVPKTQEIGIDPLHVMLHGLQRIIETTEALPENSAERLRGRRLAKKYAEEIVPYLWWVEKA